MSLRACEQYYHAAGATQGYDRLHAKRSLPHIIGDKRLLMPPILIIGNDNSSNDIFLMLYH